MSARSYTYAVIPAQDCLNVFLSQYEAEKVNHKGQITEHARWLYGQAQGFARSMEVTLPALPVEKYPED